MSPEPGMLDALIESVADGSPVDWRAMEGAAVDDRTRRRLRQLELVAAIAEVHRTLPDEPIDERLPDLPPAAGGVAHWGHLLLLERIGEGSFGEVHHARDAWLDRDVALKLLKPTTSGDANARALREARTLARVRHLNVVTVHGADMHNGRVGLWMELLRGRTLEQQLARQGPFGAREAALIGIDVCRALAAIHAAGLVHRDIKAANVMREDGGRIVLMDLGTGLDIVPAAAPALQNLAGTPLYLAPEILSGAPASERTDLYSLGVLLYHLVTGAFPIRAAAIDELRDGHAKGIAVRLRDVRADLPSAFVRLVDRAIATDPAGRQASAGELEADLIGALNATDPAPVTDAVPVPAAPPVLWKTGWLAAGLLAILALAAYAVWPTGGPIKIAVLPLTNLSGDPAQAYFADGMTDELIATLGQLGGFTVISRTSVARFNGTARPLPEIARALNVDAVVEGSVLVLPGQPGDDAGGARRVRINARLILAGTDAQIWNRTFERVLGDVFVLQSDVAKAVAEGIALRLTSRQQQLFGRAGRQNVEALDAYLQGRYLLWNNLSRDNFVKARDYLERAVRLDPGSARAYAGLARCYTFLDLYGVLSRPDAARLSTTAAMTAVRLDQSLSEAQHQLGEVAFKYQWDWAGAERAYRQAVELNPSDSFAHSDFARFLMAEERLDEALDQAKLAVEADPLSGEANSVVGLAYYYQRKYDEAIAERLKAIRLDPSSAQHHLSLGRAYAGKGVFDQAVAELEQAVALSGHAPFIMAELARTYAVAGRRAEAEGLMASLVQDRPNNGPHLPAQYETYLYAALGDFERAFESLDQAVAEREWNLLWARVDPRFDALRQDPRFADFLKRLAPTR